MPGRDVPGATIHDVELLAMLVVDRSRVGVAVDDLDRPLGILELYLLVIALIGNLVLAFLLVGRRVITARLLLLLLAELLCELLDLPALLSVVAPGVVHHAPWPTLVAAGGLARSLLATWVVAPTSRCSNNRGSGSTCQRLVVVIGLLLLHILVLATALSSSICFRLADLPYLWSSLGVSCMPFCSRDTLVRQAEELKGIFHIMCGQFFEHLLISHALSKSDNNRSIGDKGDGVSNLENPLDKGPR
jgi:hypothetical protein